MKLAWATDIHLNYGDEAIADDFCARVRESGAEMVLVGGDIAESLDVEDWLHFLAARLTRPIYFVLGNHDYYGSDVRSMRERMRQLDSAWARWLPAAGVVELTPTTGLVGHGGWGDARLGEFGDDPVLLSDYFAIADLRESAGSDDPLALLENLTALKQKLHLLGSDAADTLRPAFSEATGRFREVIVLTHVPPFREACWRRGQISEDRWLPGFTCKAMGDMLAEIAQSQPNCSVTVLCGHTHGWGEAQILPNLHVLTDPAQHRAPDFRIIEVAPMSLS